MRRQVVEKGGGERPEELDLGEAVPGARQGQSGRGREGAGWGRDTRLKESTLALDSWLESPGPGGAIMGAGRLAEGTLLTLLRSAAPWRRAPRWEAEPLAAGPPWFPWRSLAL